MALLPRIRVLECSSAKDARTFVRSVAPSRHSVREFPVAFGVWLYTPCEWQAGSAPEGVLGLKDRIVRHTD